MSKLAEIEGVTIRADFNYGDTPVVIRVRANFLTPEIEKRLESLKLSSDDSSVGPEEQAIARNNEMANILSLMIASWDIEDAEPTPETFLRIGFAFMSQASMAAMEAVAPGKRPGTA